jgi:hypothetical protein
VEQLLGRRWSSTDLTPSDPNLELLYSFALRSAGKEQEALAAIKDAYPAYLMAGQPEELQHLFADVAP